MNRREFLAGAAAAGAAAVAGLAGCMSDSSGRLVTERRGKILLGACRPLKDASLLKSLGYDFIEYAVAPTLIPEEGAEAWKRQRDLILALPLPLRSCNGFLPGKFRLVGTKNDQAAALMYAETACRRADEVGLKTIVFGSSGARNVPCVFGEGGKHDWTAGVSVTEGRDQFVDFVRQLASRISDCKVEVVLEPLNPNESNIVQYVWQGVQICRELNSPRIRQLADFYHMMLGWETAASIDEAGDLLRHCHVAKFDRYPPDETPAEIERLRPYFEALKRIGYAGGVSCECRWPKDLARSLETALKVLKTLI